MCYGPWLDADTRRSSILGYLCWLSALGQLGPTIAIRSRLLRVREKIRTVLPMLLGRAGCLNAISIDYDHPQQRIKLLCLAVT